MADTNKTITFRAVNFPIPNGPEKKALIFAGKAKDHAAMKEIEGAIRRKFGVSYTRPEYISVQNFVKGGSNELLG